MQKKIPIKKNIDYFNELETIFYQFKLLVHKNISNFISKYDIRNPNPDSMNQILELLVNLEPEQLSNEQNSKQVKEILIEIQKIDAILFPNRYFQYSVKK